MGGQATQDLYLKAISQKNVAFLHYWGLNPFGFTSIIAFRARL